MAKESKIEENLVKQLIELKYNYRPDIVDRKLRTTLKSSAYKEIFEFIEPDTIKLRLVSSGKV